jgi:hypothetical protein
MSYEDNIRRQMEQQAAEQQCPVEGEVDAAFAADEMYKNKPRRTGPAKKQNVYSTSFKGKAGSKYKLKGKGSGTIPSHLPGEKKLHHR